jgi:uncharacterized membrane protein
MTAFTAWKFDTPDGAEQATTILRYAEGDGIVTILDYATVSWPVGADEPKIKNAMGETARGAGWGALWGVLLGSLFVIPVVGGVVGAAIGGLAKSTQGTGIRKEDLERIRTEITEGTSGLFAVTENGDLDRLGERFRGVNSTLLNSNLTEDEQKILLESFGN